jgi:hypothetical protein
MGKWNSFSFFFSYLELKKWPTTLICMMNSSLYNLELNTKRSILQFISVMSKFY